jgi:hypothetical protein
LHACYLSSYLCVYQCEYPHVQGGKGVILGVAGQDASEQFWQFHNKQILKKYEKRLRIGTVKGKAPKAQ